MINHELEVWNRLLALKNLPFGSVHSIANPEIENQVYQFINDAADDNCLSDVEISKNFILSYVDWIKSTKNNTISGLDEFTHAVYTNGTTEAFDKFYMKHRNRRLRYFRGEYMYHAAAGKFSFDASLEIEHGDIDKNDVVVISLPFAGTGNEHPRMKDILDTCDKLSVPVLLDCCYFGVCAGINFDFTHQSIEAITFSLSKNFPVQHLRIGIRLTRKNDDDLLFIYNKNNYTNRLGCSVGNKILKSYSPDFNYNTYHNTQEEFCKILNIEKSNCVFFGISKTNFQEYNRGIEQNRLCFSKYLYSKKLPEQ